VILGTAGHIDHGKTTLVRALTGVDTDRLPEEKKRGITIELGFAPLVLEGVGTIGVVDVPGHEAFVRTMVAGATGVDLALVVVAADEGVMPQTREHLAILDLLGVRAGVIALTKCDLVEPDWLALVEDDVRSATARVLSGAPLVATSAETGQGIPELRAALAGLARSIKPRFDDDVFRLPVDRAFTIKGTGTVVTGTVWSGRLERDEIVRVLPGNHTARVRGIQGHGERLGVASAGNRAAIALSGVDVADVPRGCTIVADREWQPTTLARADITFVPGADVEIRPRTWLRLHVGTSEVGARVVMRRGSETGQRETASARIVFEKPVLLRAGDRFVLRATAPLNTIAGGVITDPYAPRRAVPWVPDLSMEERLDRLTAESGAHGLELSSLRIRLGVREADCRHFVSRALARNVAARVGGRLVARATLDDVGQLLVEMTCQHHADHSLEAGVPVQALRSSVRGSAEVADAALAERVQAGELVNDSGIVAAASWSPVLTASQTSLAETLISKLLSAGAEPPSIQELVEELGAGAAELLRYLERNGEVIQVEQARYYAAPQVKLLVERLRDIMAVGIELSPSDLRDKLGLSRKYLIPFLEYCDRVGYTSRTSTGRVWRGA
jgi:selenocysteine-specific elongation factor